MLIDVSSAAGLVRRVHICMCTSTRGSDLDEGQIRAAQGCRDGLSSARRNIEAMRAQLHGTVGALTTAVALQTKPVEDARMYDLAQT
jgi:hypothetical protein